jgi:uncharacterized protein YndB with AHSA1/START domain
MTVATANRTTIEVSASEPVAIITRTLNAPRDVVWRAVSQPEHLVQWWGPHGYTNKVAAYDFRVGGKWRIETTDTRGNQFNFHGEFREIARPEKIIQTFGMEGMWDGRYSVDSLTLTADGPRTLYRVVSRFPSIADRDFMIASGMEKGMNEGFERLDALLVALTASAV